MSEKNTTFERTPLFTGDYTRDTAVSDGEKAVEVSLTIYDKLESFFKKKKIASQKKGE